MLDVSVPFDLSSPSGSVNGPSAIEVIEAGEVLGQMATPPNRPSGAEAVPIS